MKGNINLISYDCYQQATEKQLAGLKWKENRVYYISEIHNEKMQDEIYGYIDDRCRRLSLSTVVNDIYRFDLLKEFLNEKCTSCSSITDKKWEELERGFNFVNAQLNLLISASEYASGKALSYALQSLDRKRLHIFPISSSRPISSNRLSKTDSSVV